MSTVQEQPPIREKQRQKPKIRHCYDPPYDIALCGHRRDLPMDELATTPTPGAEYCVVCWHMHFGSFPA